MADALVMSKAAVRHDACAAGVYRERGFIASPEHSLRLYRKISDNHSGTYWRDRTPEATK